MDCDVLSLNDVSYCYYRHQPCFNFIYSKALTEYSSIYFTNSLLIDLTYVEVELFAIFDLVFDYL